MGLILYLSFWIWILKKGYCYQLYNLKYFVLVILIFVVFFIEGIADATFVHNRGLFILMLLGIVLSDQNNNINRNQTIITN